MGALSNKMPDTPIMVMEYSEADRDWKILVDFEPPRACERCWGPFKGDGYWGREAENRLGDTRPVWQRDIICKVCKTADRIDNWIENNTHGNLPYNLRGPAFDRLIQIAPEYQDKWNWCVDTHHEYKKRLGKV
jgi:hypothetical protein